MRSVSCTSAALVLGAVALSGCAAAEHPEVARVATAFEDVSGDPESRCELLAPAALEQLEQTSGSPCATALEELPLAGGEVSAVEVWGGDAQVRLEGDTVFLTRTAAGWRVVAAACTPREGRPYDCVVEGA